LGAGRTKFLSWQTGSEKPPSGKPKLLDQVRKLLGHEDVRTTMIYMYVLNRPDLGMRSPLD
jgi:hypothetical protein